MNTPATIKPETEIARCETKLAGPCGHGLCLSVIRQKVGVALVLALLKRGRPPARLGAVIISGLDTVNRVLGTGAWPHIRKEIGEATGPKPAVAHLNPPASVAKVMRIALAVAARLHRLPTPVSRGADHVAVGVWNPVRILARDTAARSDMIEAKVVGVSLLGLPALALAKPARVASSLWDAVTHCQFVEFLSGQIEFLRIHIFVFDGLVTNKNPYTGEYAVNI